MFKSRFKEGKRGKVALCEIVDIPNKNMPIDFAFYDQSKMGEFNFPLHFHDEIEMVYILKGEYVCVIDGIAYKAVEGDVIVIPCKSEHSIKNVKEGSKFYNFLFDYTILNSRYVDNCEMKYIMPWILRDTETQKVIKNTVVVEYIKRLAEELENKETGYELYVKSLVFGIFSELFRHHVVKSNQRVGSDSSNKIKRVLVYIEENYIDPITLNQVSEIAQLNKFDFCRQFKTMTGRTFVDYLNYFRVRESLTMLQTTVKPIAEVASAVGFGDCNYFTRLFKNYMHESPSEYRKSRQ